MDGLTLWKLNIKQYGKFARCNAARRYKPRLAPAGGVAKAWQAPRDITITTNCHQMPRGLARGMREMRATIDASRPNKSILWAWDFRDSAAMPAVQACANTMRGLLICGATPKFQYPFMPIIPVARIYRVCYGGRGNAAH
jgi:hypothetical protein